MAGKTEILRALEDLPEESLKQVKGFIDSLKKRNGRARAIVQNRHVLAKKQLSAIKKWAGTRLKAGFSGREQDEII
ncbi:MAG TPA: hypothetical protein VNL14_10330 [Candidatus Acidoferrales bacterium]|nr:hypothetical protein [Candidatus Acidoferrales bacterium]